MTRTDGRFEASYWFGNSDSPPNNLTEQHFAVRLPGGPANAMVGGEYVDTEQPSWFGLVVEESDHGFEGMAASFAVQPEVVAAAWVVGRGEGNSYEFACFGVVRPRVHLRNMHGPLAFVAELLSGETVLDALIRPAPVDGRIVELGRDDERSTMLEVEPMPQFWNTDLSSACAGNASIVLRLTPIGRARPSEPADPVVLSLSGLSCPPSNYLNVARDLDNRITYESRYGNFFVLDNSSFMSAEDEILVVLDTASSTTSFTSVGPDCVPLVNGMSFVADEAFLRRKVLRGRGAGLPLVHRECRWLANQPSRVECTAVFSNEPQSMPRLDVHDAIAFADKARVSVSGINSPSTFVLVQFFRSSSCLVLSRFARIVSSNVIISVDLYAQFRKQAWTCNQESPFVRLTTVGRWNVSSDVPLSRVDDEDAVVTVVIPK